jgi:UDP-2,3-diacylglucosamine pyrophosphatase LpxH
MTFFKIVISDLHLADGHAVLDGFGDRQQSALEGLLSTTANREFAEDVELIVNGDCFDFLAIPPYKTDETTDSSTALEKLEKVIGAHEPFFTALRRFVEHSGRHITFIGGNHDIELGFAEVRERLHEAIGTSKGINFCLSRSYRPLPDVLIEHGHQHDFWNAAHGLWDEKGEPLATRPASIQLPLGTQYFQQAAYPMSVQYPYFDHFEPSMDLMHQIAMLCLLNPPLIHETAELSMQMLSYRREAAAGANKEGGPQTLFEEAMQDFLAFSQDMRTRRQDWHSLPEDGQAQAEQLMQFFRLREALEWPLAEALAQICLPGPYAMAEDVARGMQAVLAKDPAVRYAIAGHTHMMRNDRLKDGTQVYLNTAAWTSRYALPVKGELTSQLIEWLRQPDWNDVPLRDVTQMVFALIEAEEGNPSDASLCAWEGGINGHYRVLA